MIVNNFTANSLSQTSECHDVHHYRTLANIVQSCATTMFLCTWAILHPSVPLKPYEAAWKRLLRRIAYMMGALLAPEAVLVKAIGDWAESSEGLVKVLQRHPTCGWTETHAIFAWMGGFQLVNEDGSKKQLREEIFFDSISNGDIDIPKITMEEILDRSKGDGIAKTIVVVQTFWFALQIINRVSQRLPVTKLELTTLAHVLISVFIYWCWWNKPLNVRFPIDVYPITAVEKESLMMSMMDEVSARRGEDDSSQDGQPDNELNSLLDVGEGSEFQKQPQLPDEVVLRKRYKLEKSVDDRMPRDCILDAGDEQVTSKLSVRVRIGLYVGNEERSWTMLILGPLVSALSGVFGAIHCLGWNSTFSTQAESILWRVSAIIVTVTPTVSFAILMVYVIQRGIKTDEPATMIIVRVPILIVCLVYIFGRICLLVVAFLSLRELPENAYLVPSWTLYIPHIS